MKYLQIAVGAAGLAAATGASAGIVISGSELNSGDVTYTSSNDTSGSGASSASYNSTSPGYAKLVNVENSGYSTVTVNPGALGVSLGTLNNVLANGASGAMSFDIASISSGDVRTAQWVVTVRDPNNSANTFTYYALSDQTSGANHFNQGNSTGLSYANAPINALYGGTSWSSVASSTYDGTTIGTWNVISVGVNIGDVNSDGLVTFEIDSITLNPIPEANTMIAAALLFLPIGAGLLRMRRNKVAA